MEGELPRLVDIDVEDHCVVANATGRALEIDCTKERRGRQFVHPHEIFDLVRVHEDCSRDVRPTQYSVMDREKESSRSFGRWRANRRQVHFPPDP
jgi:hypothetical protein